MKYHYWIKSCLEIKVFVVLLTLLMVGCEENSKEQITIQSVQIQNNSNRHVEIYFQSTPEFRIRTDYYPDSAFKYPEEYAQTEILRITEKGSSLQRYSPSDIKYYNKSNIKERGEIVFSGKLSMKNHNWFFFTDSTVEQANTYFYFIKTKNSIWHGPYAISVRRSEVWYFHDETGKKLKSLSYKYPDRLKVDTIGFSRLGKPIYSFVAGNKGPILGVMSGIHPGESGPEIILGALENLLANHAELLSSIRIAGIPVVNADGRERLARYGEPYYIRTNAAGVDLNRNFSYLWDTIGYSYGDITSLKGSKTYRGTRPFSEPESKIVRDFFGKNYLPDILLSYHHLSSVASCPMNYFINITNWDDWEERDRDYQEKCVNIANLYGNSFFETDTAQSWYARPSISGGTVSAWMYKHLGIPSFDMEGGKDDITKKASHDEVTVKEMRDYQRRTAEAWSALGRKYLVNSKKRL